MRKDEDISFLQQALDEARKCLPTETAYCVGCVIVDEDTGIIIARGYSREMMGNTHAEQNAIYKYERLEQTFKNLVLYSTMEPCSRRLSGNDPCSRAILNHPEIHKVVIGTREPPTFINCEGLSQLRKAGVEVECIDDIAEECLAVAKRGH